MLPDENEQRLLRSVTLQNAQAVFLARERAERELRESNERITNILESISDAFIVFDKDWRLTYVNPQAEEIFKPLNKSRATLLGKNYWLEFPDLVGTPVEKNFRRAVTEKVKIEFDTFYPPLNSWFQVRAYPARDGLSVYFLDITEQKRAAETLRENAERLRAMFNQAAVGIAMGSLEGQFLEANQKFSDILGYSIEELRNLSFLDVTHADDLERTRLNTSRLLAGEISYLAYEKRYVRKDGSSVWSLTTVNLLKDAAGKPQRYVGVIEDITSRKVAEKALRESEERFRAIVQATPECVKVVGPDGTLLAMNSAGCGMVEAGCETDVIGQSVYSLIAPEFREKFIEFNESVCKGNNGQFEFQIIGLKGTPRWMETHAVPMQDPSSGRTVQLAVTRDVTARKADEEKLRRSEEELRALANSIPQLAWMADSDGHIFWFNRGWYEYTGTTFDQMEGEGWKLVHDPKMLPLVTERWAESVRTGTPFEMEFPIRGADRRFRWFLTRVSPFRDPEGNVTRWFGTNTNIDEQRQLLQSLSDARDHLEARVQERTTELKTANESLRDLSARLMKVQDEERRRLARELHDSVGQILAAISMNIGVVQAQSHKLDSIAANAVLGNAQLVQQASNEIRTLSHLLHPPLLEIAGLASAIRWYVDGFSERSKIKVDVEIPSSFGRLPDDVELAIFRIVQECLTNIHRHSGSDSATLRIQQDGNRLMIRLQDNGKGITLEKQLELGESSRSGVGLRGMRERLRHLGGTLEISSNGNGTLVCATLVVEKDQADGRSSDEIDLTTSNASDSDVS
ncbi:MAG: two-component hybrid sensor and regulator [Candidatus Sulfotelmatobacter sp.]|nr:two-component hybrid sensor and regulator [Candidatus Sulfotelmatobacter sp.]